MNFPHLERRSRVCAFAVGKLTIQTKNGNAKRQASVERAPIPPERCVSIAKNRDERKAWLRVQSSVGVFSRCSKNVTTNGRSASLEQPRSRDEVTAMVAGFLACRSLRLAKPSQFPSGVFGFRSLRTVAGAATASPCSLFPKARCVLRRAWEDRHCARHYTGFERFRNKGAEGL